MYQDKSVNQSFKLLKNICKKFLVAALLSSCSCSIYTHCDLPDNTDIHRYGRVVLWEDQHVQESQFFIRVFQKNHFSIKNNGDQYVTVYLP